MVMYVVMMIEPPPLSLPENANEGSRANEYNQLQTYEEEAVETSRHSGSVVHERRRCAKKMLKKTYDPPPLNGYRGSQHSPITQVV